MENNKQKTPSKKSVSKIIIPIVILTVIGGIWFFKNSQERVPSDGGDNSDFDLHVKEELNLEQLKSYGLPIMIDFGADSCAPCKAMAPVLEKLNKELRGKAIIVFVDVWKYQELSVGYPLRVIPTQVFFDKDGKPFKPSDPEGMQMNMYSMKDTNEHVFTTHEGGMTEEMILDVFREMGVKP